VAHIVFLSCITEIYRGSGKGRKKSVLAAELKAGVGVNDLLGDTPKKKVCHIVLNEFACGSLEAFISVHAS
jgi:hypothetical protein